MKYKGINYDVGTKTLTGRLTRVTFDINTVAKEIEIIKNELHCNAIRISGWHLERIVAASEIALKLGLTVWFSPALHYENRENTFKYIIEGAVAAEKLRAEFSNLVFVAGCELSVFTSGFIKGDTGEERIATLFAPLSMVKNILGIQRKYNHRLNKFLSDVVKEIKNQFHGAITYASGTWEKVNWKIFDLIGVDHYRSIYNKANYGKELQRFRKHGKPLIVTEFGCCAYKGAEDKGAMAWAIVDWKKEKPELKGDYIRDEQVQSKNILELLDIFENEKVSGAFVFTFISYNYVYNEKPAYDLDMASYGIVKAMPYSKDGYYQNLLWLPKLAFFELGKYYSG